jgi:hypothetical protein
MSALCFAAAAKFGKLTVAAVRSHRLRRWTNLNRS